MIAQGRAHRLTSTARIASVGLALFCGSDLFCARDVAHADEPAHSAELDAMIIRQAKRHGVPETLVRRIVMRESRYNPRARNHSFWGLMQISYPTAKSMGFKGSPSELLNPVVNLTYAVPYLANAFVVAGKREDAAVRLYASGYYATARSRGLLGALRTADSKSLSGEPGGEMLLASADPASIPQPQPAPDYGPFGALFAPNPEPAAVPPLPIAAMPDGKPTAGESVDLVPGKGGLAAPPKKWTRDGGVTTVARGEQRVEQVAAYSHAADDAQGAAGAKRSRHAKAAKTTTFATLELPATGQAYAAASGTPASALAQAAPQAAIDQATAGQAGSAPAVPGQQADAAPTARDSVEPGGPAPRARKDHAQAKRRVASKVARAKVAQARTARTADVQELEQPPASVPAAPDAR